MTTRREHHFSRRRLLASLGATAALSPFVPLLEREARGQAAAPTRLILFFTPHATFWPNWMAPSSAGNNVVLGPILQPLAPYQNKLAFIRGLGLGTQAEDLPEAHSQGFAELWTGSRRGGNKFASSASVDQYIAQTLNPGTRFRTVELGVQCLGSAGGNSRMIYAGASQPIDPEQSPQKAFTRLFGSGVPAMSGGAAPPSNETAYRKSVLDLVLGELGTLQNKVSAADRTKMQAHTQAVRDLEQSLQTSAPVGTRGCAAPALTGNATPNLGGVPDMPLQLQQQTDILVAALACNLTRVASMQVSFGDNDNLFPYKWLGIQTGHHSLT
ncbi:MAG: hypothetical protein QOI66_132, partial [Myxococcales bacterium]|nr:hypothetical protein [Myxococcales bacterium]